MKKYKCLNETKFTKYNFKKDDIIDILEKNKLNIVDVAVLPDTNATNDYVVYVDKIIKAGFNTKLMELNTSNSSIIIDYRFVKGGKVVGAKIKIATSIGVYFEISFNKDVDY